MLLGHSQHNDELEICHPTGLQQRFLRSSSAGCTCDFRCFVGDTFNETSPDGAYLGGDVGRGRTRHLWGVHLPLLSATPP